jgi:tetratricopeptide (TPR) repeat protein
MTIDTDREPTPSAETDDAISETAAEDQDSAAPAADQPGLLPSWLRVAVGIVVLAVLVVLAYPNLTERFAPATSPIDSSPDLANVAPTPDPSSDQALYMAAADHYQAGRFAEAWSVLRTVPAYAAQVAAMPEIAEAEQAVQATPESKEAHFKLGTVWARAELLVPAECAFRRAIALDSQYVDAYVNLGVVNYQLGRLADALAQYDAALAITPDDADVHHNKGAVYVQQALQTEMPDEALLDKGVAEFERALEINPNLPQACFSLGVVYNLRGQSTEALAMFKRFQELDDGSDPQATDMAKTYLEQLSQ